MPNRLVVACLGAVVVSYDSLAHSMPPLPNYITQEQLEEPTFQQRSKRVAAQSFIQEAILTAVEITKCNLNPAKLAMKHMPARYQSDVVVVVYAPSPDEIKQIQETHEKLE